MGGLRAWVYRHRGLVPVVPILFALAAAEAHPVRIAVGLALMAVGEGVRLWGAAHLGMTVRSGRPRARKLVTGGPFARTRHPIYWGNFGLATGYGLASGAGFPWFPILVGIGFLLLYRGHARAEENALAEAFPAEHRAYREQVPGFRWRRNPARTPGAGAAAGPSWRRALRVEAWTLHAEFWLLVGLWIRFR